jgi:cytochrome P450
MPFVPSGRALGHVAFMRDDPLATVMKLMQRGERMSRVRLGVKSGFFLFEPTDIRRVLMDAGNVYTKTTRGYEKLRILLGNGLVTSDGDFWLRQRRIAQPAFHRSCIQSFAGSMVAAATDQCDRWRSAACTGAPVDVAEAMNFTTLRIAGETLMSVDVTTDGREVGEAMARVLEYFNRLVSSPVPWPEYWPTLENYRMWNSVRTLRRVTDGIIDARRRSGAQIPDLLGMFMAATDPETGDSMNDRQLRDEVLTMLLAGHETTANGLAWMLYLLSKHPEVTRRLESEIDTVLAGR